MIELDRTREFFVTQRVEEADRRTVWEVLQHMLKCACYPIHN
ncbi:MAG: hypothetical protein ACJAVR_003513, partial [Paracoccaceae bacterium]